MWSRLRAVALSLAALLVIAGSASGADRPSKHGRVATTIHLYAPFNGGGIASGVRVAKSASGYCWENSLADNRADAFRCFVGNSIYDPCFADQTSFARYVLCLWGAQIRSTRWQATKVRSTCARLGVAVVSLRRVARPLTDRPGGRAYVSVARVPLALSCSCCF